MIAISPLEILMSCDRVRCPRCRVIYDNTGYRDEFNQAAGLPPCPKCEREMRGETR